MSTPNQPDDEARRSASSTTEQPPNRQVPAAAQERAGQESVTTQGNGTSQSSNPSSPQLQPRPLPRTGTAETSGTPATPEPVVRRADGTGTPAAGAPAASTHHSAPEGQQPVRAEQPHAPQHQGPRVQPAPPTQAQRTESQRTESPRTESQPTAAQPQQRAETPQRAETQRLTGGSDRPAATAAGSSPAVTQNGRTHQAPTPPWQRAPQSSLNRPGDAPVAGRIQSPTTGQTPTHGGSQSPLVTGTAASHLLDHEQARDNEKTTRQEAARAKSAGIDGPTRSIARPELAKDMPDLSEVRHPLPTAEAPAAAAAAGAGAGASQKVLGTTTVGHDDPDAAGLRATVQLRRIDPWSTLKVSLVISVALFFVWMIAVGLLYVVLDGMGVWDRLNSAFTDIVSESNSGGLISAGQVFGYAAAIGIINVILFTALATIGSFIYNQCTDLVGGVQVTLADPD